MALPIVLLPEPLAPYIILICFKLFILMPSLLNVAMFLIDKDLIIDYNYFLIPQILCIIYLIILLLYESPSMPSNLPVTLYIIDTISLNLTLHAPNRHFLSNIYRD